MSVAVDGFFEVVMALLDQPCRTNKEIKVKVIKEIVYGGI